MDGLDWLLSKTIFNHYLFIDNFIVIGNYLSLWNIGICLGKVKDFSNHFINIHIWNYSLTLCFLTIYLIIFSMQRWSLVYGQNPHIITRINFLMISGYAFMLMSHCSPFMGMVGPLFLLFQFEYGFIKFTKVYYLWKLFITRFYIGIFISIFIR